MYLKINLFVTVLGKGRKVIDQHYYLIQSCPKQREAESSDSMGLNHTAAMLSREGLKTSFPNISTRRSGYEIYIVYGQYGRRANKAHWRVKSSVFRQIKSYYKSHSQESMG